MKESKKRVRGAPSERQKAAGKRNWAKRQLGGAVGQLQNVLHELNSTLGPGSTTRADVSLALDFAKQALARWDTDSEELGYKVKPKEEELDD